MKKVLTVLVVLALVCGAAFAAETHKITLKSTIDEVLPVFHFTDTSLDSTNKATDGTAVAHTSQTTNEDGGLTIDNVSEGGVRFNADASPYTVDEQVEIGDLSKYDLGATFTVTVSNPAKSVKTFKLAFTAGSFTTKMGVGEAQQDLVIDAATKVAAENTALTDASGVTTSATNSESANYLTAVFNGTTLTPTTTLGTYYVLYKADSRINPGEYTADIKLEITVEQ